MERVELNHHETDIWKGSELKRSFGSRWEPLGAVWGWLHKTIVMGARTWEVQRPHPEMAYTAAEPTPPHRIVTCLLCPSEARTGLLSNSSS